MRVLLTRAVEDAARTQAKLEAMGHNAILSPVLEMVPIPAVWPNGVVDALLATSAQAFQSFQTGPSPEARRVTPLYLVGSRTADAARAQGFLGDATVSKNAAALATALGTLTTRPGRMVYLAGRDRKPDIEASLAGIGQKQDVMKLDVMEVYEARPCKSPTPEAVKALRQDALDGVLHFSRRSAALFIAAASAAGIDIRRPAHFCLSEDVAAPLREAGCTEIYISEKPNEPELLALVDQVELWLSQL